MMSTERSSEPSPAQRCSRGRCKLRSRGKGLTKSAGAAKGAKSAKGIQCRGLWRTERPMALGRQRYRLSQRVHF